MKKEPLKNKYNTFNIFSINKKEDWFFERKDIKSAVQWLKEELNKEHKGKGFVIDNKLILINKIIDQAFEDALK